MSEFRSRILMPLAVPVAGLVVAAIFVFAFSRVLLAVPKYWSVTLAGVLAAEILGIAALVAAVRRITGAQRVLVGLLGLFVLMGGGVGMASGIRPIEAHLASVEIVADELNFTQDEVHVPAGHEFAIEFINNDASIDHNVAIYTDDTASTDLFIGDVFPGVATKTYHVPALEPGEYFFRCDVHPLMAGTMIAEDEDGSGGHDSEQPGHEPDTDVEPDLTVASVNFEFDTDTITLPAETEVHIAFANQDSSVPHNIAFYTDDTASESIFVGEVFNGVQTRVYTFTTPPAGEYFFRCDLHPPMQGTLVTE